MFAVLGVGFVAYGLSIFFYVYAQRLLGAARTSAYYAVSPFIGALLSLVIFRELPHYTYFIALAVMAAGAWLCAQDKPLFPRRAKSVPERADARSDTQAPNDPSQAPLTADMPTCAAQNATCGGTGGGTDSGTENAAGAQQEEERDGD